MSLLSVQATRLVLTAGDVNRLRSWAALAREQLDDDGKAWTSEDTKLLNYLDDTLVFANELAEC